MMMRCVVHVSGCVCLFRLFPRRKTGAVSGQRSTEAQVAARRPNIEAGLHVLIRKSNTVQLVATTARFSLVLCCDAP